MVERIAHGGEQAQRGTYDRLAHERTPARWAELDAVGGVELAQRRNRDRQLGRGGAAANRSYGIAIVKTVDQFDGRGPTG